MMRSFIVVSARWKNRRAASALRRGVTSTSMTWPSWSKARYTQRHTPPTFRYVSSTDASADSGVNPCTHR